MSTKNIIIKGKVFEIVEGKFVDYIAFDNFRNASDIELMQCYSTLYECYKNPCKKKVVRYSNNLLYMKRLEYDNSVYLRHIGIIKYNAKTFTQRFILEIENFHYIVDIGFDKNKIIICSTNYTEAVDKLKNL